MDEINSSPGMAETNSYSDMTEVYSSPDMAEIYSSPDMAVINPSLNMGLQTAIDIFLSKDKGLIDVRTKRFFPDIEIEQDYFVNTRFLNNLFNRLAMQYYPRRETLGEKSKQIRDAFRVLRFRLLLDPVGEANEDYGRVGTNSEMHFVEVDGVRIYGRGVCERVRREFRVEDRGPRVLRWLGGVEVGSEDDEAIDLTIGRSERYWSPLFLLGDAVGSAPWKGGQRRKKGKSKSKLAKFGGNNQAWVEFERESEENAGRKRAAKVIAMNNKMAANIKHFGSIEKKKRTTSDKEDDGKDMRSLDHTEPLKDPSHEQQTAQSESTSINHQWRRTIRKHNPNKAALAKSRVNTKQIVLEDVFSHNRRIYAQYCAFTCQ